MRFVLLLRGVNVGGKNRVVMTDLKEAIETLGYSEVSSYINSGNLFFSSEETLEEIYNKIDKLLRSLYDFDIIFVVISAEDLKQEYDNLPTWWQEEFARKDVLFYTDSIDQETLRAAIEAMRFGDEIIHFGSLAIYWGKYSEANYRNTAYAKQLIKTSFYKKITIRNGNTFEKIYQRLVE